ncbi:hypothetical protein FDR95_16435 [Rhizobiaceae bacterium LC148]|nr:hypothetical protein FDR95_16435 [Rhizobiaceae bacterium LC148]
MKQILPALLGGLLAGLSAWAAQSLGSPNWGAAISAAVGGFLGAAVGQKLSQ